MTSHLPVVAMAGLRRRGKRPGVEGQLSAACLTSVMSSPRKDIIIHITWQGREGDSVIYIVSDALIKKFLSSLAGLAEVGGVSGKNAALPPRESAAVTPVSTWRRSGDTSVNQGEEEHGRIMRKGIKF